MHIAKHDGLCTNDRYVILYWLSCSYIHVVMQWL